MLLNTVTMEEEDQYNNHQDVHSRMNDDDDDDDDDSSGNSDEQQEEDTSWGLVQVDPPPFQVDERVYARDHSNPSDEVYYEAVIRQARCCHNKDGMSSLSSSSSSSYWNFLVHFAGWNSRWDQWMPAESLLKQTDSTKPLFEASRRRRREGNSSNSNTTSTTTTKAVTPSTLPMTSETTTTTTSSRKRRRTSMDVSTPTAAAAAAAAASNARRNIQTTTISLFYEDDCALPLTLQTVLVEEFEYIHGHRRGADSTFWAAAAAAKRNTKIPGRMLHDLPASVPIRKLLNHFARKKIKAIQKQQQQQQQQDDATTTTTKSNNPSTNVTVEQVQNFCQGLGELFQEALGRLLLYPQEKPQYAALMQQQQQSVLDIYSCEYLLRLYVKLPLLLQHAASGFGTSSSSSSSDTKIVGQFLRELVVLMQKNRSALFPKRYREIQADEWMEWERQQHCKASTKEDT